MFGAVIGSVCFGGEVLLNNGDRLTGSVEKIVEGKLYLKSDLPILRPWI